jgi:hypothetical protein
VVFSQGKSCEQGFGAFPGGDADGAIGLEIDKGRCHFAPVAKFERTLAQAATGDDANGISGTAVDFHKGDQAFAVPATRLLDPQPSATQHC